MKRLFIFLFACLLPLVSMADSERIRISGTVLDETTDEPLPNVAVVILTDPNVNSIEPGKYVHGQTTDLDGKFVLADIATDNRLLFKLSSYENKIVNVAPELVIKMKPTATTLQTVNIVEAHKDGDFCQSEPEHITKGTYKKINGEWVCIPSECEEHYFVNNRQKCEREPHNEGDECSTNIIKTGKWHQLGPNNWTCIPIKCVDELYYLEDGKCIREPHNEGDFCSNKEKHIKTGKWHHTGPNSWVCMPETCIPPYALNEAKDTCIDPQEGSECSDKDAHIVKGNWHKKNDVWVCVPSECEKYYQVVDGKCKYFSPPTALVSVRDVPGNPEQDFSFDDIDKKLDEYFDKSDAWKNDEGKFNSARLISDSVAGVVLGTVGGVVTSKIIKNTQVKNGFEDLKCTIGGQNVATYGNVFTVGVK